MTDARDIVERLGYLHVWPQSIADTHADTLTPRQIERLYDVGNVAADAADTIASLRKQLENARSEALEEAAKVAESHSRMMHILDHTDSAKMIGSKIRALKGQPC